MANRLINRGKGPMDPNHRARAVQLAKAEKNMSQKEPVRPVRAWMYSADAPAGQIFTGQDAIEQAAADGWVDSPGAVTAAAAPKKAAKAKTKAKPAPDASE